MMNIDKNKLVLVHDKSDLIKDLPLETKEIGYYQDSWNRFKKNKGALVAFIVICFVFFMVLVGPYMKPYDLPERDPNLALRFKFIEPKIPFLENFGIFDGRREVTAGKYFLNAVANSPYGEGVIISGFPQELVEDVNHPNYADITEFTVVVDHYKFVNYTQSYMPTTYFGNHGTLGSDPLAPVIENLSRAQFEAYLARNIIIDVISITESPNAQDPANPFITYKVRVDRFKQALNQLPEDTYFWFGTNEHGRDLFTEIWRGARISILMAIGIVLINAVIGLTIGSIVGYYGGVLDLLFDRFVEIVSAVPFLSVLVLLTLRFGTDLWVIIVAFTATGWIGSYGTGRMQFYRFKNREYVLAARTLGASDARIMFKHILPNTLGLIVTSYALAIPAFVFSEATYSFLGIINYKEAISVGMLIQQGQAQMHSYPYLLLFPSIYIAILMIAFNLFGNGLRDAFNPSLRGVE
ncbi:ABC transporter permease [Acholeplasma equirhinis]|uniref:ABC transporter permease n=1 Tax=Acholeplasma equirhinis TaxID=555393 RepID=UPI00197A70FD|nr:ABC transporter permease [Acholeplasma equirhinis]MBN3491142.1 ABC transporter permease [Acholeplasma equirhinis]